MNENLYKAMGLPLQASGAAKNRTVLGLKFLLRRWRTNRLGLLLHNLWLARFFSLSRPFAGFSEQFEETVDPMESANPSMPSVVESDRSDIGVVACRWAAFPATPGGHAPSRHKPARQVDGKNPHGPGRGSRANPGGARPLQEDGHPLRQFDSCINVLLTV